MAGGNPWKISALISACYELVLVLFLLFRMVLSLVVLELTNYLSFNQIWSRSTHRHRSLLCSGHLPAFSPCRERNAIRVTGTARGTARYPRGLPPERGPSEDLATNRKVGYVSAGRKAGVLDQARSDRFSSIYKRKKRTPSLEDHTLFTQDFKVSVDGETCKCIASEIDLYDDLIQVGSKYLKQKDRGHEEVILSLLKALQEERRNLRSLYEELEEERIAAETAANEAMGMILRLQEEKSALQMEVAHYQRMAEEKALHDEQAIQFLEENLCRKESERLLLLEELSQLQGRSYGYVLYAAENADDASKFSEGSKPILPLPSIDEVSQQVDRSVIFTHDYIHQKCILVNPEESLEARQMEDQPLKRHKSFRVHEQEICKDPVAASKHSEKNLLFNEEDDTKSILVQLCALEKQLLALEESEILDLTHQVEGQLQEDHFTGEFLGPDGGGVTNAHAEDKNEDVSKQGNAAQTPETDVLNVLDEEKVVNVDVTNVSDGPYCEVQVSAAEEILEFHKGQHSRSKSVQWEAFEEEKHLDMPSFVPTSNAYTAMAKCPGETCKRDVQCLHSPSPVMCEEEKWDVKRVALEGINLRLQALENESTHLRHCSGTSNHA